MTHSLIYSVPDSDFIAAVKKGNNYSEISRSLGNFSTNGAVAVKKRIDRMNISFTPKNVHRIPDNEFYVQNVFRTNLRERVLKDNYMPYVCKLCGNRASWSGKSLTLELDHIDGNENNNVKSNLRWLCPNCHSQTDTYRGKNIKSSRKIIYKGTCSYCGKSFSSKSRNKKYCSPVCQHKATYRKPPVSRDKLYSLLLNNSFAEVGRLYNVSDNAIRKWCIKLEIPSKAKYYKGISNN